MSGLMEFICLNAREAIMTCAFSMHGLVISIARNRMDAITSLQGFGAVHLRGAVIATVLWRSGNGNQQHVSSPKISKNEGIIRNGLSSEVGVLGC